MKTAICTLFEGNYHYGVGALINSLYYYGFRGVVWVGYRGNLPPWAKNLKICQEYQEFTVTEDCVIRFIQLNTPVHFATYKPDFMLQLWEHYCPDAEALFYFDPDIVIKCRWSFFEDWVTFGVAVCEDVESPVPNSHPLRMAWRRFYEPHSYSFDPSISIYVNSGFIGLTKINNQFLHEWKQTKDLMEPVVEGFQNLKFKDRTFMFFNTDQDALNIAMQCSKYPFSTTGKEGMGFVPGGLNAMFHATGAAKPWKKNMTFHALAYKPPSLADKSYWQHTQSPIPLYFRHKLFWKKIDILCGTAIGRLVGR